jgi:hypothetical protein
MTVSRDSTKRRARPIKPGDKQTSFDLGVPRRMFDVRQSWMCGTEIEIGTYCHTELSKSDRLLEEYE